MVKWAHPRKRKPCAMTDPSTVHRNTFHYSPDILINYELQGSGETPIVFLHGFAAGLVTWHDIRDLFPRKRFRLYFLDLKGFGFSSKPHDGRYTPKDQAAVVTAFMESQGLRNATLVGHSMGGGIALIVYLQALAAKMPEMIGGLILIDCAAYPQQVPEIILYLRSPFMNRFILQAMPVLAVVRYTLERVFRNKEAITAERIARYAYSFGREGIAYVLIQTARQLFQDDYSDIIAGYCIITAPTLIIWGKNDPIIAPDLGIRLNRDIPGSRLVFIDNCGHNPHEERPVETFAAISRFLDTP